MDTTARLIIACADQRGIVAKTTGFLFAHGANITSLQEHASPAERGSGDRFFMRVEFTTEALDVDMATFEGGFQREIAGPYTMDWRIARAAHRKRMVILASREDHALLELLWRHRRGELHANVTRVISNHLDLADAVSDFGIAFRHVPVGPDTKAESERTITELLGEDTELIVLARYMQILSAEMVRRFAGRIINIHHSFLPAFVGAKPYHQAHVRGVKLIGATAHYVTAELDAGPIIEQDVTRVSHRHTPQDLVRLGRSIEREVLARAVQWHLEDRVIVHGNKTVVFV